MYDYIIVGSGLFGAVFTQQAIEDNKKVLVIEKRNHIGGNCYTENIENINVHKYGPHIFHTNDEEIWKYINKFAKFNNFVNRPKINYKNEIYSFPINLFTLYQLWGVRTPKEAQEKLDQVKIKNNNPQNLEEWILSQVGEEIYQKFIKGYTIKQWGRDPKKLPATIIKRLPIRLNFDDNYFFDKYQGIPIGGYTQIFEKMLDGAEILLSTDFFKKKEYYNLKAKKIVYTGKIDEYFNYCYGNLEYRSLVFKNEIHSNDYQGNAIINYTDEQVEHTRVCEHKHFEFNNQEKTVITKEYPAEWSKEKEAYYPINDEKNSFIYKKYKVLAEKEKNVIFGGRLATYQYYDMHQIIGSALKTYREQKNENR